MTSGLSTSLTRVGIILAWLVVASSPWDRAVAQPGSGALANRENLARDKTASASATQDDSKWPGAAVDGEPESRWCAADGSFPQWLQVDLGRPETVTGCRIVWEAKDVPYAYTVDGSPDAKSWSRLVDASKPTTLDQARSHPCAATGVRYVRLNITGAGEGQWASVCEFEVFGTRPAPAVARSPANQANPQSILKEIKLPPGFEAAVFAAPPDVRYPTCLAAAPTGEVFVGVDENGSLDAKANRGRVVRCVDTNDDGKADQFNDFAVMDSPRGLVWDAGTLYVLHPPTLSAYHDTNGDGVADKSEVLVNGIGFDLKHRGADHTTNGIRLAIDGFLYVAVGDYGFVQAQGKDGEPLQLLGGGVVRVRTDGTGLEIVSRGQRNIYDVAIDPQMNLFTRDNTNDGDGWDVRLSHVVPTGHYGYPSLFKRFGAEIIPPLADYGGGSPCGSLFLQEPGLPAGFGNTLYTCEWGRGAVFMHPLKPRGATFEAGQETFVTIPRPTDIDVDGSGRIFISSWRDGGFTFSKPNVGYVIRVTPKDLKAKPFPDLAKLSPAALVAAITADSAVLRLAAQREWLRRGGDDASIRSLEAATKANTIGINGRTAAVFTLAQALGPKADDFLIDLMTTSADLRECAATALGNRRGPTSNDRKVTEAITAVALKEMRNPTDARLRLALLVALGRIHPTDGDWQVPVMNATQDPDPTVAQVAVRTLVKLRAVGACLTVLQTAPDESRTRAASRALAEMHDPRSLDALIDTARQSNLPLNQKAALRTLCRMYHDEAPYVQGQWWGTRPDTSGPYYKPVTWAGSEAIGKALRQVMGAADPALQRWLLNEMIRHKLDFEETTPLAMKLAGGDPELRAAVVNLMVGRPRLSPESIRFLETTATDPATDPALQAKGTRGLIRHLNQGDAREATIRVLAAGDRDENPSGDFLGVWTEFARDNRLLRDVAPFVKLAEGPDLGRGTVGYAVLVAAATNEKAPEAARATATRALDRAWANPSWTPRVLRAVGLARVTSLAAKVEPFLTDERTDLRQAAEFAARRLNLALKTESRAPSGPKPTAAPPIAATAYEAVLTATLADPGDATLGTQLFERQGCVNCHAVTKTGPIKGPYLGDVAARYNRSELVESILKPSARIAQGFETQKIATTSGQTIEGFVVREAGEEVELRNSAGNVVLVPKKEIEERGKGELSVMPQGLMDPLTPHDLASLIAYFESIKGK